MGKLIIDGKQVYEIDEECMKQKEQERMRARHSNRQYTKEEQNKNTKGNVM